MNDPHKQRTAIPVIADEPDPVVDTVRAAVRDAVRAVIGDVTVILDATDCVLVGATLRMLARTAPQDDVRERLERVGQALSAAGWVKS